MEAASYVCGSDLYICVCVWQNQVGFISVIIILLAHIGQAIIHGDGSEQKYSFSS